MVEITQMGKDVSPHHSPLPSTPSTWHPLHPATWGRTQRSISSPTPSSHSPTSLPTTPRHPGHLDCCFPEPQERVLYL